MPLTDAVVVMTDQLQLPKNTRKGLLRMGLKPVSLGNQMLFAFKCITLVHAQIDAAAPILKRDDQSDHKPY